MDDMFNFLGVTSLPGGGPCRMKAANSELSFVDAETWGSRGCKRRTDFDDALDLPSMEMPSMLLGDDTLRGVDIGRC